MARLTTNFIEVKNLDTTQTGSARLKTLHETTVDRMKKKFIWWRVFIEV